MILKVCCCGEVLTQTQNWNRLCLHALHFQFHLIYALIWMWFDQSVSSYLPLCFIPTSHLQLVYSFPGILQAFFLNPNTRNAHTTKSQWSLEWCWINLGDKYDLAGLWWTFAQKDVKQSATCKVHGLCERKITQWVLLFLLRKSFALERFSVPVRQCAWLLMRLCLWLTDEIRQDLSTTSAPLSSSHSSICTLI